MQPDVEQFVTHRCDGFCGLAPQQPPLVVSILWVYIRLPVLVLWNRFERSHAPLLKLTRAWKRIHVVRGAVKWNSAVISQRLVGELYATSRLRCACSH